MIHKSIFQRSGRVFENRGPINPIVNMEDAHSMALAGDKAMEDRKLAVKLADGSPETLTNTWLRSIALGDLAVQVDTAEERTRRSLANSSTERAMRLYDLVELVPVDNASPTPKLAQGPNISAPPKTQS